MHNARLSAYPCGTKPSAPFTAGPAWGWARRAAGSRQSVKSTDSGRAGGVLGYGGLRWLRSPGRKVERLHFEAFWGRYAVYRYTEPRGSRLDGLRFACRPRGMLRIPWSGRCGVLFIEFSERWAFAW